MTSPAWVPPQLPEVGPDPELETSSRLSAVLGLGCVAILGFGLGVAAWNARTSEPTGPQAQAALDRIDDALSSIATENWGAAYEAFDQSCADFGLPEFRAGFGPVFGSYGGHSLTPPASEPFEVDEIVLVRGTIDLGGSSDNTLRAELRFSGDNTNAESVWRLGGLRIDES